MRIQCFFCKFSWTINEVPIACLNLTAKKSLCCWCLFVVWSCCVALRCFALSCVWSQSWCDERQWKNSSSEPKCNETEAILFVDLNLIEFRVDQTWKVVKSTPQSESGCGGGEVVRSTALQIRGPEFKSTWRRGFFYLLLSTAECP